MNLLFFFSIAFSTCFIPTCASIFDLDLDFKIPELTFDLTKVRNVSSLLTTLAEGFKPLLKELEIIYTIPDAFLYKDPMTIIKRNGFKVSEVKITSNDSFILTAWRIECRENCGDKNKYPVLLQHGLFCSGVDWLFMEPDSVLPYILANNGYEVWIGNARGTKYSQEHVTLDPKSSSSEYWEHSVHEMGQFDVMSSIETIKEVAKVDKVNYVGYSMGTTMFFIYQSENPDHYEKNVNRFVGLAPAMFIGNFATQFKLLGKVFQSPAFHNLLLTLGKVAEAEVDGPLKYTPQIKAVFKVLNTIAPYCVPFAKHILHLEVFRNLITGDPLIKNTRAVQRAMGHFPENISMRTVRHYVQFFAKKTFGRFDHPNPDQNMKAYSNAVPPPYGREK